MAWETARMQVLFQIGRRERERYPQLDHAVLYFLKARNHLEIPWLQGVGIEKACVRPLQQRQRQPGPKTSETVANATRGGGSLNRNSKSGLARKRARRRAKSLIDTVHRNYSIDSGLRCRCCDADHVRIGTLTNRNIEYRGRYYSRRWYPSTLTNHATGILQYR